MYLWDHDIPVHKNASLLFFQVMASSLYSNTDENEVVEGYVVSSESCCFQSVGAKYYREVCGNIKHVKKYLGIYFVKLLKKYIHAYRSTSQEKLKPD